MGCSVFRRVVAYVGISPGRMERGTGTPLVPWPLDGAAGNARDLHLLQEVQPPQRAPSRRRKASKVMGLLLRDDDGLWAASGAVSCVLCNARRGGGGGGGTHMLLAAFGGKGRRGGANMVRVSLTELTTGGKRLGGPKDGALAFGRIPL